MIIVSTFSECITHNSVAYINFCLYKNTNSLSYFLAFIDCMDFFFSKTCFVLYFDQLINIRLYMYTFSCHIFGICLKCISHSFHGRHFIIFFIVMLQNQHWTNVCDYSSYQSLFSLMILQNKTYIVQI